MSTACTTTTDTLCVPTPHSLASRMARHARDLEEHRDTMDSPEILSWFREYVVPSFADGRPTDVADCDDDVFKMYYSVSAKRAEWMAWFASYDLNTMLEKVGEKYSKELFPGWKVRSVSLYNKDGTVTVDFVGKVPKTDELADLWKKMKL